MGAFFAYTIYSGVFLLFLFLFYKVLISNEKQISLNRILLLSCYALAFAAWPLSRIEWSSGGVAAPGVVGLELPMLKEVGTGSDTSSIVPQILIWIYLIGATLVLLKTLFSTARLLFYIRNGRSVRMEDFTLVVMPDNNISPFSFGRKIVMSERDYETVRETVTAHELAHIQCRHYLDLVIAHTVCVVLWYNPASWMMLDELKLLHEYQADAKVIDRGVDISAYQMLLIRKTVGNRFQTLANNLNHSKLKNRIAMMQKEKSGGMRRMKVLALAIAPMVAFGVMNLPAVASDLKSLEEVSLTQEPVEVVGVGSAAKGAGATSEDIVPADFPGGTEKLMEYLALNIRYPESAMKENRSGRTIVGYTIGTEGSISNIKILKSSSPDLDEEAIRVVKKMPNWIPSKRNGKAIDTEFALPVNFRLPSSPEAEEITLQGKTKLDEVVVVGYGTAPIEIPEYHGVAVPSGPSESANKEDLQWEPTVAVDEGLGADTPKYGEGPIYGEGPMYVDGVKYEKSLDNLDAEKIDYIKVYRKGNKDYPEGAIFIMMKK